MRGSGPRMTPRRHCARALICPSCLALSKNFSLLHLVETAIEPIRPASIRGAYRGRHGRWERDAVDAMAAC